MSLFLLPLISFQPRPPRLPLPIIIVLLLQLIYSCESGGGVGDFEDDEGYYYETYHYHNRLDQHKEVDHHDHDPHQQQHQQQPPLQQIQQQDMVYSYIGNFIITREAVFLLSIVALVLSWRALIHVLWYSRSRHGLVNGLFKIGEVDADDDDGITFPASPTRLDYVLDRLGYVFDEAMKTYTDYSEEVDEVDKKTSIDDELDGDGDEEDDDVY